MKKLQIKLSSIEDVRSFVNTVTKHEVDMDLHSGRYIVDAKSLMGIFSLDLMSLIDFIIHTDDEKVIESISKDIDAFIVK